MTAQGKAPAGVPARRSVIIGRDGELGTLRDLVLHGDGRLVTLTGTGGVGKTTLALELGRIVADHMPDGVGLIDLSTTPQDADTDVVANQWLDSLGLVVQDGVPVDVLVRHLEARRTLLVVDNCEQVAAAVGVLVDLLLDACPYLHVLATSRQPLKVRGETVYAVSPLAVPTETTPPSGPDFEEVPAVALFLARARAADPAFRVDGVHAPAVARICRRLEGLPLAIELAAAHVHALSPAEIEQRLGPEQDLLTTEILRTPPRQATLEATLDWSYHQLGPLEQQLQRGLSVFAGGWSLAAAEEVCGGDAHEAVGVALQSLVERSLVIRSAAGSDSRYRLLEPVREYAARLADETGERDAVALSHAQYFLSVAARFTPSAGTATAEEMQALAAEYPNCMAAIRFAETAGRADLLIALATALAFQWRVRGNLREGLPHLTRAVALAGTEPSRPRGIALLVLADVERVLGRYDAAIAHAVEGFTVYEAIEEVVGKRTSLCIQGDVWAARGDYPKAHALYDDAWSWVQAEPHPHAIGYWHANLGEILLREGRLEESAEHLGVARAVLADAEQTWYAGRVDCWLGAVERRRGRLSQARDCLGRGFEELIRYGDRVDAVTATEELARVAFDEGDPSTAATLLGAASALREAMALPLDEPDRTLLAEDLERIRGSQATVDFETAWARGRALSFEDVAALARRRSAPPAVARPRRPVEGTSLGSQLTRREREVAELVAQGLTNPQVAERLFVSPGTVRGHVEHILGKLGLTSRVQIATWLVAQHATADSEKPVI